jgi:hypothetical protein
MSRRAKKAEVVRRRRADQTPVAAGVRAPEALVGVTPEATVQPFGPCWLSLDWDDEEYPELVLVIVTRELEDGGLLPAVALVDRTCVGVKDAQVGDPQRPYQLGAYVRRAGLPHGGVVECEPLTAQSIVFHAIDFAQRLGFEPHPAFPSALFGPRPDELLDTPWSRPAEPYYKADPLDRDDPIILARLAEYRAAVKADGTLGGLRRAPLPARRALTTEFV